MRNNDKMKILLGLESGTDIGKIVFKLSEKYDVKMVNDAEEAYEFIHTFDPDLAILDYTLSKINPIDLHDGISFIHSHLKLVICVSNENYEVASRIWSKRAMDFIIKPFTVERFLLDVNKIVRYILDQRELDLLRKRINYYESVLKDLRGN